MSIKLIEAVSSSSVLEKEANIRFCWSAVFFDDLLNGRAPSSNAKLSMNLFALSYPASATSF